MKINLFSRSLPSRVPSWCRDCGQVMDGHVPCLNNQHGTRHLIVLEHAVFAGARKESLYSMSHLTATCMICASENYGKNEQWLCGDSKNYSSYLWEIVYCTSTSRQLVCSYALSQNCEKRLLTSLCPSVHPSAWKNLAPTGRIFIQFGTWDFPKICGDNSASSKSYKNNGYFTWGPIHFLSYCLQFFLKWQMFQTSVQRKTKYILCSIIFFKVVSFMRYCGKT